MTKSWVDETKHVYRNDLKRLRRKIRTARPALPKQWGPSFWKMLHFASLSFTPSKRRDWSRFLRVTLPSMLPCTKCRRHYRSLIRRTSLHTHLKTKESLATFLFLLHHKISADIRNERRRSRSSSRRRKSRKSKNSRSKFGGKKFLKKYSN